MMIRFVNSTTTALVLFLSIGAILPQSVRGHFFWAETDAANDKVVVTFSEDAGVPDKVIAMMNDRVKEMAYTTTTSAAIGVALSLNDETTALEGDLPKSLAFNRDSDSDNKDGPALVSGYLDFGAFQKFQDLEYSFGAQVYSSENDYDGFFRPLLKDSVKPSIAMRNCGAASNNSKGITTPATSATMSYQFDVGGFPSEGPLGVCIYRKGGLKMGCGEFSLFSREKEEEEGRAAVPWKTSIGRNLRGGENLDIDIGIDTDIDTDTDLSLVEEDAPYILYAIANKTITDKSSGGVSIAFASTSVYFEGACKEHS